MKRNRIAVAILITFLLVLSVTANVVAEEQGYEVKNTELAEILKQSGFFKGSDKGFELERVPTRVEGAVMLVRMLGKEQEVLNNTYSHPFTDVPNWANNYVGYLYENGLANGVSEEHYGADRTITAQQYYTFILRSLGYDDSKGDFKWNESLDKAKNLSIINEDEYNYLKNNDFLRDDTVLATYRSLKTNVKDKDITLIDILVAEEVISVESAEIVKEKTNEEVIEEVVNDDTTANTKHSAEEIVDANLTNTEVYKILNKATTVLEEVDNYTVVLDISGTSIEEGELVEISFFGNTFVDNEKERFYSDWNVKTGTSVFSLNIILKEYSFDGKSYGYSNFTEQWEEDTFDQDGFNEQFDMIKIAIEPTKELCENLTIIENDTQYILEGIVSSSSLNSESYEGLNQDEMQFVLSIVIDKETNLPLAIIAINVEEDPNKRTETEEDVTIIYEIVDYNNTTIEFEPELLKLLEK